LTDGECGKNYDPSAFIVRGSRVQSWPWMASLGFFDEENQWQHQCGATLISDQHFLTASHCIKGGVKKG
jgi:V8-like Glu-specific endopeptidase